MYLKIHTKTTVYLVFLDILITNYVGVYNIKVINCHIKSRTLNPWKNLFLGKLTIKINIHIHFKTLKKKHIHYVRPSNFRQVCVLPKWLLSEILHCMPLFIKEIQKKKTTKQSLSWTNKLFSNITTAFCIECDFWQ